MKPINEKIVKHNLRHALTRAAMDNNYPAVAKAAQAIFEAGYEIEDMGYTPGFFIVICNQIIVSGWVPNLTDEMILNIEKQESGAGPVEPAPAPKTQEDVSE